MKTVGDDHAWEAWPAPNKTWKICLVIKIYRYYTVSFRAISILLTPIFKKQLFQKKYKKKLLCGKLTGFGVSDVVSILNAEITFTTATFSSSIANLIATQLLPPDPNGRKAYCWTSVLFSGANLKQQPQLSANYCSSRETKKF